MGAGKRDIHKETVHMKEGDSRETVTDAGQKGTQGRSAQSNWERSKKKTQETETRTVDLLGPQGTKQGSLTFKIEHVRGTCQSMADGSTEAWEARQGGAEQGREG